MMIVINKCNRINYLLYLVYLCDLMNKYIISKLRYWLRATCTVLY